MTHDVQYWVNEIKEWLQVIEVAQTKIGKALKELRGDRYKRTLHFWRQDHDPDLPDNLKTFEDYCRWKWNLSANTINHYIRAYELVEDLEDAAGASSSLETTEEYVLRPLTKLKNKVERQRAWEVANQFAQHEEKKLSSKHTTRAVAYIKNTKEDLAALEAEGERLHDAEVTAPLRKRNAAELTLVQTEHLGIAEPRAKAKVTECLDRLFRDENEKARLYLARLLADRLFGIYPQLMDEPIRSFSLKEVGS